MAPFSRKKKRSTAADDAPAAPRGGGKVSTMAMSAVLVLAGAAGHRYLLAGDAPPPPAAADHATTTTEEALLPRADEHGDAHADGDIVTLDDLTINLADPGQMRYLRVGIGLVVPADHAGDGHGGKAKSVQEAWTGQLPKASAAAVRFFSQKTMVELQGPGAMDHAAIELAEVMRQTFGPEKVSGVLFTSFLMQ